MANSWHVACFPLLSPCQGRHHQRIAALFPREAKQASVSPKQITTAKGGSWRAKARACAFPVLKWQLSNWTSLQTTATTPIPKAIQTRPLRKQRVPKAMQVFSCPVMHLKFGGKCGKFLTCILRSISTYLNDPTDQAQCWDEPPPQNLPQIPQSDFIMPCTLVRSHLCPRPLKDCRFLTGTPRRQS